MSQNKINSKGNSRIEESFTLENSLFEKSDIRPEERKRIEMEEAEMK